MGLCVNEYMSAAILGLVQGLTEFLPVSSTGHLILASALLGEQGERIKTFEVVIQAGSILAVVWLYRGRFLALARPRADSPFSGPRGLYLLFLTCLPAGLLGIAARPLIREHLFSPLSVALALIAGALVMLLVEKLKPAPRLHSLDELTPRLALGIGCCQCLALWPGFSRSASTIMGGMLLGAARPLAAEYSFLAAVPILTAAAGLDLYKSASLLSAADVPYFLLGGLAAFIAAFIAIKTFIGLMRRVTLLPFACYRLLLAPLVLWLF